MANAIDELKGENVVTLDVAAMTTITNHFIIATGRSNRQVKAMADNVMLKAKQASFQLLGSEGFSDQDWIIVDYGDVVVHLMQEEARNLYDLESLWSVPNAVD